MVAQRDLNPPDLWHCGKMGGGRYQSEVFAVDTADSEVDAISASDK